MADLNEPKKETVPITPSLRTEDAAAKRRPASPIARPPAPVRPPPAILPANPSAPPAGVTPPVAPSTPMPKSPGPSPKAAFSPSSGTVPASRGPQVGPEKETVRAAPPGDSPMKATVKQTPIRHPGAPPAGVIRAALPPSVANSPKPGLIEAVPTQFCWALFGVSALLLFIQLWTYFS